jgi:hypothetical protein
VTTKRPATLLAILAVALVACSDTPPAGGPRIVLEPADAPSRWRATFRLDHPIETLRFERPSGFRTAVWEVVTPGWTLQSQEGTVRLTALPGAASDTVVVEFPVYTDSIPKDYELFRRFTDDSLAIYTGHFYAIAPAVDEAETEAEPLRTIELIVDPGDRIVIRGETFRQGRVVWKDDHGDGTYVYVGRIEPIETDDMIAILDPGAPAWLLDHLERELPAVFERYTTQFDEPLPWKPSVLFNFVDVDVGGLSSGGGTLTGVVQMSATGSAWHHPTPDAAESLLYLMAHEAAHFWNGQLHPYEGDHDSWLHEGSADAFADLLLYRIGTIDERRLAERRSEAVERCVDALRTGSLSSAYGRGRFDAYYSCGSLIAVWSAASIDGPPGDERLFDVWRVVFDLADGDRGSYDRTIYFRALEQLGADPADVQALERFVDAEHEGPATALSELMRRVGIDLVRLDRPYPEGRRERAASVIEQLMAGACAGRYSFDREGDRLRTYAIEGCEPFARELRVVAIEDHPIADGDLALAAAIERCDEGAPVRLGLEDGADVAVPCRNAPLSPPETLGFPILRDDSESLP